MSVLGCRCGGSRLGSVVVRRGMGLDVTAKRTSRGRLSRAGEFGPRVTVSGRDRRDVAGERQPREP